MKVGLTVHPERGSAADVADRVRRGAVGRGMEIIEGVVPGVDVVIAVGGDGTMLETLADAMPHGIPVLGINVGLVGYLADIEPEQLDEALDRLAAGVGRVEERTTLTAIWPGGSATGINDMVLEKIDSRHSVRLAFSLDGERVVTYRADGVIVATPTGSTAYAFSAGGPLVPHGLDALVVSPVAAHNLFSRPLVVGAGSELRFEVLGHRDARLNIDGAESVTLTPGSVVEVTGGVEKARFMRVFSRGFGATVRRKFGMEE